jgi:methionyl-tRNA formyltransferase
MRIIFLGSPAIAVIPLEALVRAGYQIVAVVTQPDRPAGRRNMLTPPPVKLAAERLGLPVFQPQTLRELAAVAHIAALQPDLGVVAAYGEILRKNVLELPPLGYLNIHPSLLPRYRGPAPVTGAILAGDPETGVSVMRLDSGMDSGPILAQQAVPLPPDARAGNFTMAMFELGSQLLLDVLPAYIHGTLIPQPQDHSRATFTAMLRKQDGQVDWHMPAVQIERMVRAYDPWPGTYTFWKGQQLKLLDVGVRPDLPPTHPIGTLWSEAGQPLVTTGTDVLELRQVQPAGKRPMTGAVWLNGQRNAIGQQFDFPQE